ncbi:hypothetical protein A6770_05420 [Nostoc minutum NIES-26]|uniref:Histidine kinase n=1 Tax=Nostoc minutum NIES-26 TaxID=1844469 RepID=A0A367Q8I0_9NOSO|nr:hypothetical protein [Dendronalium sp. ChiSLP03b]MDZ8207653.1 hypothetical protein [Dendronalium sp. ChiSLP03b]RCJ19583.1 hypothetical protein A6770_05420 [Nostoc minutum NIES-26]
MLDIPPAVINYILNYLIEARSLAYLLVKKDGSLLAWGGKLAEYGITNLRQGGGVGEQVFFLEGLLPLDDIPLFLPLIKTEYGICTDVHMFPSSEGDWVLLLDSTWDENQLLPIQQSINDFSLLQEKLTRIQNH